MLGKVNLSQKVKKKIFKQRLPQLQTQLSELQMAAWQAGLPVIVVFEGWDGAGKGACLQKLTAGLDPRRFKLHAIREASLVETRKPWMWRFWIKTPAKGELVIFDRSWYGLILDEHVNGLITNAELRRAVQDVLDFERTLADEGALIVKFFLHIHQDEQKLRFKKRLKNPETAWRVEPADWEQHAKYEQYSQAIVSLQKFTATDWAPWTIVPATDVRFAQLEIYETLIAALQGKLGVTERQPGTRPAPPPTGPDVEESNTPTPEYPPAVGPETSAIDLEGVKIETEVVKQRQATSRRKKTAQPKEVPAEDPSATPGTNLL